MRAHILAAFRHLFGQPALASHDKSSDELVLYLSHEGGRVRIGRLAKDGDVYVFRYDEEFLRRKDVPTLPDFPVPTKVYRSSDLWPFFMARLPAQQRPDVQAVMEKEGISPDNAIEVLGRLGRKSVSSPYELELAHAGS